MYRLRDINHTLSTNYGIMPKLKLVIKVLMMKALSKILVNDFYMAYHGDDFYSILWNLDQYLRNQIKYHSDDLGEEKEVALQSVRDKIYELMENHGVDFNHVE